MCNIPLSVIFSTCEHNLYYLDCDRSSNENRFYVIRLFIQNTELSTHKMHACTDTRTHVHTADTYIDVTGQVTSLSRTAGRPSLMRWNPVNDRTVPPD